MDAEFREAFAKLSSQIADVGRDAKQAVNLSKETAHEVSQIKSSVTELNKAVFGSPNPPNGASGEITTPLVKKISSSDLEVDSLKTEIIVLRNELQSVKELNENQNSEIKEIKGAVLGFTGTISKFLNNPKIIAIGRVLVGLAMAYAIGKGWIQK